MRLKILHKICVCQKNLNTWLDGPQNCPSSYYESATSPSTGTEAFFLTKKHLTFSYNTSIELCVVIGNVVVSFINQLVVIMELVELVFRTVKLMLHCTTLLTSKLSCRLGYYYYLQYDIVRLGHSVF